MNKEPVYDFFRDFKTDEAAREIPSFDELTGNLLEEIENDLPALEKDISLDVEDALSNIPDIEKLTAKRRTTPWFVGIAAAISLFLAYHFILTDYRNIEYDLILDTSNSPTVTRELIEPENQEFLEWKAPSDYLSDDFN